MATQCNARGLPRRVVILGAGVALAAAPARALAHVVPGAIGGFTGGFTHPLTGPDHLLAMFAVGLWGAQLGGRSMWALPVAFPMVMVVGGILGMAGVQLPYSETAIALSMLVLGAAIAARWHPSIFVPLFIVAVFAIFHGYAHGVELPQAADPVAYATGFVLATGSIHVAGILVGMMLAKPVDGRLARALGAIIAAGGVYYLAA